VAEEGRVRFFEREVRTSESEVQTHSEKRGVPLVGV